jgi:hypothetical protein
MKVFQSSSSQIHPEFVGVCFHNAFDEVVENDHFSYNILIFWIVVLEKREYEMVIINLMPCKIDEIHPIQQLREDIVQLSGQDLLVVD